MVTKNIRLKMPSRKKTPSSRSLPKLRRSTQSSVSTISTAPIAIGNTIRGASSSVTHLKDGVRVVGRDVATIPDGSGSATGWCMVGGIPLTPAAMAGTILKNFVTSYAKFKINSMTFTYTTSAATSATGDIVLYHSHYGTTPSLCWTNSVFLNNVFSEDDSVYGPQWTNHSTTIRPKTGWLSTDWGMDSNQADYSAGDMFVYSKTSVTDSPGLVHVAYDISFQELVYNLRPGLIPAARIGWRPCGMTFDGAKTAAGNVINTALTTSFIGGTTITNPTFAVGEVYKFIVDVVNSTFVTVNSTNFVAPEAQGTAIATTMNDGFTGYFVVDSSTTAYWYATYEAALAGSGIMGWGATATYTGTIIRMYIKCVGYVGGAGLQNFN